MGATIVALAITAFVALRIERDLGLDDRREAMEHCVSVIPVTEESVNRCLADRAYGPVEVSTPTPRP